MCILGIDPGYATIGYGAVHSSGSSCRLLESGIITTSPSNPFSRRLEIIYDCIGELIERFSPEEAAVETLYFGRNVTTGIPVSHARGVLLLALRQAGVSIYEYSPGSVKKAMTGQANAEKQDIQLMVRRLLNLNQTITPDDAADAVALALTRAHSSTSRQVVAI